MKELKKFNIDIFGLSNATYEFEFPFDDTFFGAFENSLVKKGSGVCKNDLIKSSSMITLRFNIEGSIELICDRSLEKFDYPIAISKEVIFKFGIEEKELDDDVYIILKDTQRINIANFLYQFILLEIPMKKLHPTFKDEAEEDELIYISKTDDRSTSEDKIDPRWEALKKLK